MKILVCVDILDWAIGHLAKAKIKYNPQHTFKLVAVPPRDVPELADSFANLVKDFQPDIIHYEYFRTAQQLIELKPFLKSYPSILSHQNQRDKALFHSDWNELGIDLLVTGCDKTRRKLIDRGYKNVDVVNFGIDLDFFTFSNVEPENPCVGYAGRIVPWKRLKDVARACAELDYKVLFMGRQDKEDYWKTFTDEEVRAIDFSFMDCNDEERLDYYRNLTCYVGFSDDDYEEGTLELLEAMACGVPVITTLSGMARDIIVNGENGIVVDFGDIEGLKKAILRVMTDKELRKKLRDGAWNTIKGFPEQKMAYLYSKEYHKVYKPEQPLVSVIVPTYNRKDQVIELLRQMKRQIYQHIETIICDDNSDDGTVEAVVKFHTENPEMTIKVLETGKDGYNLAMARNMGAVEAEGDYLVFIDSRLKPDENAVKFFKEAIDSSNDEYAMTGIKKKVWFFGNKGSDKMSFVENFSAVRRDLFMEFGMFNERIDKYGGMSQEIRTRWRKYGGSTQFLVNCVASQLIKAASKDGRRKDIVEMKFKLFKMYN